MIIDVNIVYVAAGIVQVGVRQGYYASTTFLNLVLDGAIFTFFFNFLPKCVYSRGEALQKVC